MSTRWESFKEAYRVAGEAGRGTIEAALGPGEALLGVLKAKDGRTVGVSDRRLFVVGGGLTPDRLTSYGYNQITRVTVSPRISTTKLTVEFPAPDRAGFHTDFFVFKPKDEGVALGNALASRI